MTARTTDAVVRHRIGSDGLLSLVVRGADVRLRGVDGDEVLVRALDGAAALDGLVLERGDGSLSIRTDAGGAGRAAPGAADGTDLEIQLPKGASVVVDGASGDVAVTGLIGDQRYRTASGDLILRSVAGQLTAEAMSGDIEISAIDPLLIDVRTVSGDLTIHAAIVHALRAATTSGDLTIHAALAGEGPFSLETVSGDISLSPGPDARIAIRTITGDVHSALQAPVEEVDGARIMTIGAGGTAISVRSTSGDIGIVRPPTIVAPAVVLHPDAQAPDTAPDDAASARVDDLAILQALERGEIDLVAARRQLDRLDAEEPSDG
jgi:Toastrack DUF4097